MDDAFLRIDGAPVAELPDALAAEAVEGVHLVEAGVLAVRDGAATFVPFDAVIATAETDDGGLALLCARRPPSEPWVQVRPDELGERSAASFAKAVTSRREQRGYREALRGRRTGLGAKELFDAVVRERRALPGALEVPVRILSHADHHGLGDLQFKMFVASAGLALACAIYFPRLAVNSTLQTPAVVAFPVGFAVGLVVLLAAWLARKPVGRWERARVERHRRRRPRLLVLTPDGCVVGRERGPRAYAWSDVARFEVEGDVLVVHGARGELARLDGWLLDAPLSTIGVVAEAYRRAAADA